MFARNDFLTGSVALAAFCAFTTLCGAGSLVLAERGKAAEYSIVRPGKASPAQKYAAEELCDFTEKATGVRLPIVVADAGGALGERALPV